MGPEVTLAREQAALPLSLRGLSKHFGGERALDHVDLDIRAGEVHGLLGQNGSGKSTLIKILAGLHAPDPGASLFMAGQPVPLPMRSGSFREHGLSFVHQNLALVPSLTVTENLFAGRYAAQERLWLSAAAEQHEAASILRHFDIDLDPGITVDRLTPVARAQLAIVRALQELPHQEDGTALGGLLVLDEPTPFLPRHEVETLFQLIRGVVRQGASVIFVSHDVEEVMEITDRATILRDGRVVDTLDTRSARKADFVEGIVGRQLRAVDRSAALQGNAPTCLKVDGASGRRCHNVSLDLRPGEIVGLTGLVGSGYDEVPYLLYGAGMDARGTVTLDQQSWQLHGFTPSAALARGLVLIPADRTTQGAVLDLSVLDNLTVPLLEQAWRGWRINWTALRLTGQKLLGEFQVRPRALDVPIGTLSGGNQQKVVLAKWLQTRPRLILLDEPTQGVDVGAREEVYAAVRAAAAEGSGVLCASSDHEQLAALCHRVLVFRHGEIAHVLQGDAVDKNTISRHCYEQAIGA